MRNKILPIVICMGALGICQSGFAAITSQFYAALDAGVMQGNFNQSYLDQTDIILQNIQQTVQQNGYTQGIAIGYSKVMNRYLIGAELSENIDSHLSTFQSGASTSAFSDTIQVKNHVDLTLVPGVLLTDSLTGYAKIGISFAALRDNLISPVGFTPTGTSYTTTSTLRGFVGGLGLRQYLTNHVSLFAEGNYRDYGSVSLSGFQNFSANYTHTVHVYVSTVTVGAAYHF